MEPMTEQSNATYEDKVAETILLSNQVPVGSYWKDDNYAYRINQIVLGDGIASAECTKITLESKEGSLYNYHMFKSDVFVHGIGKLIEIEFDEYNQAEQRIKLMIHNKNNELFQKQCLLNPPTDTPFEDFETLHDEIIELDGYQHFFYKPLSNNNDSTCFRVMRINMDMYDGAATQHEEWHFLVAREQILASAPDGQGNNFGEITNRHRIFPITEYQFSQLVEFIENNPNQPAV